MSIVATLATLVVCLLASGVVGWLDLRRQSSDERQLVLIELAPVRADLEGTINATFRATDGLCNLIAIQRGVSPDLYAEMARMAIAQSPHIRNIAAAPDDVVRFVYPLEGNERVLGLRYESVPEQYRTVKLARELRHAVLVGPVNLVQGGRALINRTPVFISHNGKETYWGTVAIVARVESLLAPLMQGEQGRVRYALRDKRDTQGLIQGDPAVFSASPVVTEIQVPGGTWELAAVPVGGWHSRSLLHSVFFQAGILISLLISTIVMLRASHLQQARQRQRELEQEIAERQRLEVAAELTRQQLFANLENTPTVAIQWYDEDGRVLYWNPASETLYGYSAGEMLGTIPEGTLFDKATFDAFLEITREIKASGQAYGPYEINTRHKDGRVISLMATTFAIPMDQGGIGFVCMDVDMTEHKLQQERLKLSAAVMASTAEGVLITDASTRIVAVNPAFTEITGYQEAEVLGQKPAILRSDCHQEDFYQTMWRTLQEAGVWRGELWNRRKNGELFPEWLTISTLRNEAGDVTHYVGVFSDISSIKQSQEKLEHLAHFDPLTELPNRVLFQDRLAHAIDRAQRYDHQVAVLLMDLDGFKTVNDSLGHPVGDQLLQGVAARLRACVRVEDTVARLGGDEFALILSNMQDGGDAIEVVRKILSSVEQPFSLNGLGAMVTASVGIAVFPGDGKTSTELVRNADAAMYGAKEGGRNTYRFYQASMTEKAQDRLFREAALRRAIENREFEVWFQPQVSLHTGRMTGAEALVRWRDPERGLVPPIDFIPLAERTGQIIQIGEQVLDQVCAAARRWLDAGHAFGRLAINVAIPQIERSDLAATLRSRLTAARLPPDCLEIEITESLIMESGGTARDVLLAVQGIGVTTSVDDFGTGYSSLAYLKDLPIDNLKIDRAFIRDLPDNPDDIAIARAIIAMAHSLGFKVIAEGIETEAQMDFLKAEGCDEAQGYFIGKPMPMTDFESWLTTSRYAPGATPH